MFGLLGDFEIGMQKSKYLEAPESKKTIEKEPKLAIKMSKMENMIAALTEKIEANSFSSQSQDLTPARQPKMVMDTPLLAQGDGLRYRRSSYLPPKNQNQAAKQYYDPVEEPDVIEHQACDLSFRSINGRSARNRFSDIDFYYPKDQIAHKHWTDSQIRPMVKQVGNTHCALASLAYVCQPYEKFAGFKLDENYFKKLINREIPSGMNLNELYKFSKNQALSFLSDLDPSKLENTNLMKSHNEKVEIEIFRPMNYESMKNKIQNSFARGQHVIANFYMTKIYHPKMDQKPNCRDQRLDYGHFSPIVAFSDDQCLIGDVWHSVPDFTWVSYQKLFSAVDTIDEDSGEKRGLLVF